MMNLLFAVMIAVCLTASCRAFTARSTFRVPSAPRLAARSLNRAFCAPSETATPTEEAPPAIDPALAKELNELSLLEIRVGKILEVDVHPEAENLFVEKVDMGEPDGPRTIVSGLVQFCTKEQLLNKEVIVLANLKPRALKGITSAGMLLCASSADDTQVVPIDPPSGAELGALITFDGVAAKPADPGNRASKAYSKIAEQFKVNDDGVCCFKDMPFMTPQGPVTSTLKGSIS